jgi:hypothetical protein
MFRTLICIGFLSFSVGVLGAQNGLAATSGPVGPEGPEMREQEWLIPTEDGSGRLMHATVFRPPGAGRILPRTGRPCLRNLAAMGRRQRTRAS